MDLNVLKGIYFSDFNIHEKSVYQVCLEAKVNNTDDVNFSVGSGRDIIVTNVEASLILVS